MSAFVKERLVLVVEDLHFIEKHVVLCLARKQDIVLDDLLLRDIAFVVRVVKRDASYLSAAPVDLSAGEHPVHINQRVSCE